MSNSKQIWNEKKIYCLTDSVGSAVVVLGVGAAVVGAFVGCAGVGLGVGYVIKKQYQYDMSQRYNEKESTGKLKEISYLFSWPPLVGRCVGLDVGETR